MIEAIKEIFMILGMCVAGLPAYILLYTIYCPDCGQKLDRGKEEDNGR